MTMMVPTLPHDRLRIRVRGAVQGVGFRPFVYGLATRNGLSGFVLNDGDGVLAEVEGEALDVFLAAMLRSPPPLARIESVETDRVPALGRAGFAIRPSLAATAAQTRIGPDVATCAACLEDMLDPASRFYLYPFVNCTQCGPRASMTHRLPYDSANTSMARFPPCDACAADYSDQTNRRFHAEGIACPTCGPRLDQSIDAIAAALIRGQIIALKGIGGFHLLSDARNETAVAELRRRKHRPEKPFAVMIADIASVADIAAPTVAEQAMLDSPARPIVLIRSTDGLMAFVAPGLDRIGVILAHTPTDHLLFRALNAATGSSQERVQARPFILIATSANVSGDPLIIDEQDARANLAGIADLIVSHDRQIVERMDDTVCTIIDGAPAYIRRARGVVPEPIDLGSDGPDVIAVGAHLKATVCVTRGREAFLSQHLGDLSTVRTRRSYEETVRRMVSMLDVKPEAVACDLHPDYHSTAFAGSLGLPVVRVQHHAAHLAAVVAEHRLSGPLIGVALDGHGMGDDGSAWGGELMLSDGVAWRRVGHLRPLPFPGGDRAARTPWRMGVAALTVLGRADEAARRFPDQLLAGRLAMLITANPKLPTTSSMGRLFDAASALLGLNTVQSYEGQAAMQLEALVTRPRCLTNGYAIREGVLDFSPLLAALLEPGLTTPDGADLFHGTLVEGLVEWIDQTADTTERTQVVLSGGCMMNAVLADRLAAKLRERGLVPWLPRAAPANDGGLSLGQAAMARALLSVGRSCQPELRI